MRTLFLILGFLCFFLQTKAQSSFYLGTDEKRFTITESDSIPKDVRSSIIAKRLKQLIDAKGWKEVNGVGPGQTFCLIKNKNGVNLSAFYGQFNGKQSLTLVTQGNLILEIQESGNLVKDFFALRYSDDLYNTLKFFFGGK